MSTTTEKVFAIPELLETILLQLPIRDLLVDAQRICCSFQTAIKSSPALQEALFFRPQQRTSCRPCLDEKTSSDTKPESSKENLKWNPLLRKAFRSFFGDAKLGRFELPCDGDFENLDWNSSPLKHIAYARREASWRRMLPVQPAPITVEIVERTQTQCGESERLGTLCVEDGVRMGMLYDVVERNVEQPITWFHVRWQMGSDKMKSNNGKRQDDTDCSMSSPDLEPVVLEPSEDISLLFNHTIQCDSDWENGMGKKFRSDGYEPVDIEFGLSRTIEEW